MKFMLYFNSTSEIHAILGYILIEFELGLFSGDELLVSFIKKPSRDLQKNAYFNLRSKIFLYITNLTQEPLKDLLNITSGKKALIRMSEVTCQRKPKGFLLMHKA